MLDIEKSKISHTTSMCNIPSTPSTCCRRQRDMAGQRGLGRQGKSGGTLAPPSSTSTHLSLVSSRSMSREEGKKEIKYVIAASTEGFHRLAYTEIGSRESKRVMVCVHGLTRNKSDFDFYARHLHKTLDFRVICVDVVGRGDSDWLSDKKLYGYPQYIADIVTFLAHVRATMPEDSDAKLFYTGTSMGGLIGMILCSRPGPCPIDYLIVNDVGPFVPKEAQQVISDRLLANDPVFETYEKAAAYIQDNFGPKFGKHADDALFEVYAKAGIYHDAPRESGAAVDPTGRFKGDNNYRLTFDHAGVAASFMNAEMKDLDLWIIYDTVKVPTLVLRGFRSDLLTAETAEEMTKRGPKADLLVYEDAAHVPPLYFDKDNDRIAEWLQKHL